MLRWILNHLRRPPVRMGRVDNGRIRTTPVRNAQFVSYISSHQGFGRWHPDRHEQRLRRMKAFKSVATAFLAAGIAWVALESARAFSIF